MAPQSGHTPKPMQIGELLTALRPLVRLAA